MDKFVDLNIKSFLESEPNIKKDFEFITNYLNSFFNRNMNREKIEEYYKKIPLIMDRLFAISKNKIPKQKINNQTSTSISKGTYDLLNSENATFHDYDMFMHLFLPEAGFKNIFSVISAPENSPYYTLSLSQISRRVSALIETKQFEILFTLPYFRNRENFKTQIEKGYVNLNIFDYFFTMLLIIIKEIKNTSNKIILPKYNKNFENFMANKESNTSQILSDKTLDNYMTINRQRSLVANFFTNIFKNFINYFSSKYSSKFIFILSAIEVIWFGDFYLPSKEVFYHGHTSNGFYDNFENYAYYFSRKLNENPVCESITLPNVILLECLTHVVITLQKSTFLLREIRNSGDSLVALDREGLLYLIHKPLFYFLKFCFVNYLHQGEVHLGDIAKVFLYFISPKFKDSHYGSAQVDKNLLFNDFVYSNILFYTEIFNDFVISFSQLNVLDKEDLVLLGYILDLYSIEDGFIIFSSVHLQMLEDYSLGAVDRNNVIYNDFDLQVKFFGSDRMNLYPWNKVENQKKVKYLVNNLSNWVAKLEKDYSNTTTANEDTRKFINLLEREQTILRKLYKISDMTNFDWYQGNTNANTESNKTFQSDLNNTNSGNSAGIFLKKNYTRLYGTNPWKKAMNNEEIKVLFDFLKFLSSRIDILRGIHSDYESPVTNLRYFANYYNLLSILIGIVVIWVLVWLVISQIR